MHNCRVSIAQDGGPELFINKQSNSSWSDKVIITKARGYNNIDNYILMEVTQNMCQYAYEAGIEDATKQGSKLERIKRIIEE